MANRTIANRTIALLLILAASVITVLSCRHIIPPKEEKSQQAADTTVSKDFTGIKKYHSAGKLLKEVTFINGIKPFNTISLADALPGPVII